MRTHIVRMGLHLYLAANLAFSQWARSISGSDNLLTAWPNTNADPEKGTYRARTDSLWWQDDLI